MTTPLLDRRDVDFLLHTWLKTGTLVDRETVDAVLDLSQVLAAEAFLPHYKRNDVEEPVLEDGNVRICPAIGEALSQYAQLGLFSAGFPEEQGGLALPYVVCAASFAFFAAANVSTAAYPMLTVANARLIATFGTAAQVEAFARPQIEGRWFGTMCLSEPQAGSSLADVADQGPAGRSGRAGRPVPPGRQQDVDLRRRPGRQREHRPPGAGQGPRRGWGAPEGTAGSRCSSCPSCCRTVRATTSTVAGLNHKMGYRGTANCLLNFGESGRRGAAGSSARRARACARCSR